MRRRITVIGGDKRQISVAEYFSKDGYDVSVYGFDSSLINTADSLTEALKDSSTVLLGISPCDENMNISTPCWRDVLSAHTLISHLSSDHIIIGGKLSAPFVHICEEKGIRCIDYINREEFAVLNAVPTAEGALAIAMDELDRTIHGTKCLITGFGRIGKILAHILHSLGADLVCSARNHGDLAWIESLGYKSVHTGDLSNIAHESTVIFNTVPVLIFDRDLLRNVRPGTLIIDLASKPGGVDLESAAQLGIKVIWALSIPGKAAPATAGKIIKDTVANILNEI
ncbi:MAG: dipicolinate synthase subunit DpsA [Monoglobales bacterium]